MQVVSCQPVNPYTLMNFLKKIAEVTSMPLSVLSPRQIRYSISRKDWVDFGLVIVVSFLIVVYKVNKSRI